MRAKKKWKIIVLTLITALIFELVPNYGTNAVSAAEIVSNQTSIQDIVDRFSTTGEFVQQQLDAGYTLDRIYAAFLIARIESITYEAALAEVAPSEINESNDAVSQVTDSLADNLLRDVVLKSMDEDMEAVDGESGLSGKWPQQQNSLLNGEDPGLEVPPVYDHAAMNQAPYSIGSAGESVSGLTGGLSLTNTDMTLPGRNGLSFSLIRKYDTNAAQFYDMSYDSSTYPIYGYQLDINLTRKPLSLQYSVKFEELKYVEEDFNRDGISDNSVSLGTSVKTYGTYASESMAQQNLNIVYTTPTEYMSVSDYRTSNTNSFSSTIYYSSGGFVGNLSQSGSSYVYSGSYTPADSKTATGTCTNMLPGRYDVNGQWQQTGNYTNTCNSSMPYNSGGYSGTLNRTTTDTVRDCSSPGQAYVNCTKEWRANYSGTVTKPASDTRIWRQNYSGTVVKLGTTGSYKCDSWVNDSYANWRYCYTVSTVRRSPWIESVEVEGAPSSTRKRIPFATYSEAVAMQNSIVNIAADIKIGTDGIYNYYTVSTPNPSISSSGEVVGEGVTYYNTTTTPWEEQIFPLGKGWSWDLPYIETNSGKKYVHLAGGGSYEISGTALKGYEWEGLSLVTDTTVTVNGEPSNYALVPVDGTWKQYFTADGRLLQISDAYNNNNTIQFSYTANAAYGNRKLLSQVKDAINNTIQIAYSATAVTLTKGTQVVTYAKRKEQGKELLESVTDAEGRKTTYSYELKDAKFNLMSYEPSRAISNPYALLTKVQHPTGASTIYTYGPQSVQRYIGTSSVNQAYRLFSRKDEVQLSNGGTNTSNMRTMSYNNTDFGSSYNQDITVSTTINDGLVQTTYTYKKDYIDNNTPARFYLEQTVDQASGATRTTAYAYAKKVGTRSYFAAAPTTVTHSDNLTQDVLTTISTYDDYGNVLQETDAKGVTTIYTYDSTKHLLQTSLKPSTSTASVYTIYTRNAQGDITQVIGRKNNASGEILQQIDYGNIDIYGNVRTITTKNGSKNIVTTLAYASTYDQAFVTSQAISVSDADGIAITVTQQEEYDRSTGLMTAWVDGEAHRTEYVYDKLGRIKVVKHPGDTTFSVDYDDTNNTITTTNEVGYRTKTSWNALGYKVEEGLYDADGYAKKAKYDYDAYGRMLWSEDAKGNQTMMHYDNWSRLTQTDQPNPLNQAGSVVSTIAYDDALRQVTKTDAEGYALIETFDKYERIVKKEERATAASSIKPLESYVYNPVSGQLAEVRDAKQKPTTFDYNILGRLVSVTNANSEITQYQYDMVGNLVNITFADGSIKQKEYDDLGRVIRSIDEQNRAEKWFYDGNNNLVRREDRNGAITIYEYNDRNWLKTRTSDDETVSFTYDDLGQRLTMTDGTGTTAYHYDDYTGQLDTLTYPDQHTLAYKYYENGFRKEMTGPFGYKTYYGYDRLNRLAVVSDSPLDSSVTPTAAYMYYDNGLLERTETANGIRHDNIFDGLSLVDVKHVQDGDALNHYRYGYDANANLTSRTENEVTNEFIYDDLNRIATSTIGNETYTYDNRGNRLTLQSEQMVEPLIMEYTYDDQNRLIEAQNGAAATVHYRYNGDGLLVERTENGTTARYYYDGDHIIAEATLVDGVPQFKARYIRGNKLEAIEYSDETTAYALYNGHGDLVELRDSQGGPLNAYEYDIWGNIVSEQEQVHNPFRYSGELWDDTTQLQYLRARWYDPSVGRFINEDSFEGQINNPLSLNLYAYVQNNPLTHVDPTGHMAANALNSIAAAYSIFGNNQTSAQVSKAVILANGWNFYTALHEIAQVNIYRALVERGYAPILEQKIKSNENTLLGLGPKKTYEADVVANGLLWEVKPLGGASPKKQIEKYTELGGYVAAPTGTLESIKGIYIVSGIYMKIDFPKAGEARYSFYKRETDPNGNYVESAISTKEVKNKLFDQKYTKEFFIFPMIPVPGLIPGGIPALAF